MEENICLFPIPLTAILKRKYVSIDLDNNAAQNNREAITPSQLTLGKCYGVSFGQTICMKYTIMRIEIYIYIPLSIAKDFSNLQFGLSP